MRFSALLLLLLTLGAGCGLKVHDEPPSKGPIELDGVATGCLNGFSAKVGAYFEGRGRSSEIVALGGCIDEALKAFGDKAKGASPGFYSSEELRRFLNKYFISDAPLHEALWSQMMKVKSAWVGGTVEGFSQFELVRTRQLFQSLARATTKLEPALPIEKAAVETIVSSTRKFIDEFAPELERARSSYRLADADGLLREAESWFGKPDPKSYTAQMLRDYRALLPWARAAHLIWFPNVRTSSQPIESNEWGPLLHFGVDLYELYRHTHTAYGKSSWKRGTGREAWLQVARRARTLTGKIVSRSRSRSLRFDRIGQALEMAWPKGIAYGSNTIRISSVHKLITTVVARALAPGRGVLGIDEAMLDQGIQALERWSMGQAWIENRFAALRRPTLTRDEVGGGAPLVSFPASIGGVLSMWPALPGALDLDGSGKLLIPGSSREVPKGLAQEEYESLLWRSEISFALIRAYGRRAPSEGIAEEDLVQFYQDARPFGIDVKIFDPNDDAAPVRRFRDANLFVFSANGDDRASLSELTELLGYLLSGKRVGDEAHLAIAGRCQNGPLDPYGFVTIENSCYRREYYNNVATYWERLPGLKRFFAGLSGAEQDEYGRNLEIIARKTTDPNAWFDSDSSEAIATLVSYIETIFTRFDQNADGRLTDRELDEAFRLVDTQIAKASCSRSLLIRRALFFYLVKNGRPPARTWRGTVGFLGSWSISLFRDYSADRMQIVRIFSELSRIQGQGECGR